MTNKEYIIKTFQEGNIQEIEKVCEFISEGNFKVCETGHCPYYKLNEFGEYDCVTPSDEDHYCKLHNDEEMKIWLDMEVNIK